MLSHIRPSGDDDSGGKDRSLKCEDNTQYSTRNQCCIRKKGQTVSTAAEDDEIVLVTNRQNFLAPKDMASRLFYAEIKHLYVAVTYQNLMIHTTVCFMGFWTIPSRWEEDCFVSEKERENETNDTRYRVKFCTHQRKRSFACVVKTSCFCLNFAFFVPLITHTHTQVKHVLFRESILHASKQFIRRKQAYS